MKNPPQVVLGRYSGESGFSPMLSSNEGDPLPPRCQTEQPGSSNKAVVLLPAIEISVKAMWGAGASAVSQVNEKPFPTLVSKKAEWRTWTSIPLGSNECASLLPLPKQYQKKPAKTGGLRKT